MNPIFFHMATMPPRIEALQDSIPSVLNQCNHLYVYLNNFNGCIPAILQHPRITVYESEKEIGDTGDVGKFYKCWEWQRGYHFTVDDKLIYPHNYTAFMIAKIEEYGRKAVISLHGRNFHKRKSKSYYFDYKQFFGFFDAVSEQFVHEIGTGVMAFHTDTFIPEWEWFPYMNMTDIYLSLSLQKKRIPMLIAGHKARFVTTSNRLNHSYSIHSSLNKKDDFQTAVINSFKWQINTCKK
jgi:hypothetical protein